MHILLHMEPTHELSQDGPRRGPEKCVEGEETHVFCISIYREQLRKGKHVLHERPQTAASWQETGVERISQMPGVSIVTADE